MINLYFCHSLITHFYLFRFYSSINSALLGLNGVPQKNDKNVKDSGVNMGVLKSDSTCYRLILGFPYMI